jgi:hypothetical protein
MALSLQEQLLKAGAVNEKQVKKAQHEQRIENKKKKKKGASLEESASAKLQKQQSEQAKQSLKLNAERNLQALQKADQAAAKQLVESNRIPLEEGDVPYHYVSAGGQIKRISVQQAVADKLSEGALGLALCKGDCVLLPAEAVQKVLLRDKDAILAYNDPAEIEVDYPAEW